jgi:GntR family transcriptional regulator / MocR family aminotransferase
MDTLFEIKLDLTSRGSRQASESLYRQLKAAILDGRLTPGAKLPVPRMSSRFLGVSRNTAVAVYERLAAEGHVVTRRGSGTYVADASRATRTRKSVVHSADQRLNPFWLRPDVMAAMDFWRDQASSPPARTTVAPIDFRPALIDSRLFPFDLFRQVSVKQLRKLESRPASYKSPQGNQGHYPLRDAITHHIALTRAVVCGADDVLVTSGAQQAFDLLARVLVRPNDTVVAIEDPGYPPMRVAFSAAGARLVPVAVDDEGLIVEQLPSDVRIICVCPSHQFPLGVTMSARRRQALVAFARRRGAVILEDDYDGEFRYEGSPLEALRTADAEDVVCYVGTFSKCMLPALRLGFIVAPDWALRSLISAKNCMDWHCPTPVQMGVARFIAEGHLQRHVRRLRRIYKERRELILKCLEEDLSQWLTPIRSCYGLHVAAQARTKQDMDRVSEMLLREQIKVHAFSRYYLGVPAKAGLVFGYGTVDPAQIRQGFGTLRRALTR